MDHDKCLLTAFINVFLFETSVCNPSFCSRVFHFNVKISSKEIFKRHETEKTTKSCHLMIQSQNRWIFIGYLFEDLLTLSYLKNHHNGLIEKIVHRTIILRSFLDDWKRPTKKIFLPAKGIYSRIIEPN